MNPPRIRRVELIANTASGSVGPDAPDAARRILADHGLAGRVWTPEDGHLPDILKRAADTGPDLLAVLAGDGTARAAAELCGPDGPLVAPLPGGTMNMLPQAVYGERPWPEALQAVLANGQVRMLGGGEVEGRLFLVAAILGSPALWAPAREAVRKGRLGLALARGRRAWDRAFSGRLRYGLDDGLRGKAEALAFLCPPISRALDDDEQALEAAALDPAGAAEAFRLGVNALTGDWRRDPSVRTARCRKAEIWAAQGLPILLDGEPVRLSPRVTVRWRSDVVRVLAPA